MLYLNTLTSSTLDLLHGLMNEPLLDRTRLVGGTALALQLGHRTSIDLDLFGQVSCDEMQLQYCLKNHGQVKVMSLSQNVKMFTVNGVKLGIVNYDNPWIDSLVQEENIRMASVSEIAAMKVRAIIGRGTRKDFVDLYYLLQRFSMTRIMELFHLKYPDFNDFIAIRSLLYFDDAEQMPMPMMQDPTPWETMKDVIKQSVKAIL